MQLLDTDEATKQHNQILLQTMGANPGRNIFKPKGFFLRVSETFDVYKRYRDQLGEFIR